MTHPCSSATRLSLREPQQRPRAHRSRTRGALLAPICALCLPAACFKYQPIDPVTVQPQEEVRVLITDDAAVRLAGHYGSITKRLEGQLTPVSPDSVLLAVWIGRNYVGTSFENARQRLSLGRGEVMEVRRRELSVSRTAIVTAGVLGMIGIVINRIGFLENPNPGPNVPRGDAPDPDGIVIPIGRIR